MEANKAAEWAARQAEYDCKRDKMHARGMKRKDVHASFLVK